jgi:hypothetical protein
MDDLTQECTVKLQKEKAIYCKEQSISSCTNMECKSRYKDLIPMNTAKKLPTDIIKFLKISWTHYL